MSRIRGKDTSPEKVVRSLLHRMGYRFRLHVRIPISEEHSREEAQKAQKALTANQAKYAKPDSHEGTQGAQKTSRSAGNTFSASDGEKVAGGRMRCKPEQVKPRTPRAVSADIVLPRQKIAIFVHG